MKNRPPILTTGLCAALAITTLALATAPGAQAQRLPDLGDPDFDPGVDLAVQCVLDTRVVRFTAAPEQVEPFEATTLSWRVDVPPGCPLQLSVAGRTIDRQGSLDVVPVHEDNLFHLIAHIAGGTATLATTPVRVDLSGCDRIPVPEANVATAVTPLIDALDEGEDDFRQTAPPVIRVQSNGLFIRLFLRTDVTAFPDADVRLDMLLRFTVRDGLIDVRYGLFRPNASTVLPDDFVESKFFDRADGILADIENAVNSLSQSLVPNNRQLFDLPLEPGLLTIVHCPAETPEPATLTVRLRVLPSNDPGRFNLRIDGVARSANATDGGSTGPSEVAAGTHTVSQTAGSGTDLGDYRTFIGGDCALNGRVVLTPGDAKLCFVTNVREATGTSCQQDCRDERATCNQDPQTLPQICAQLFQACLATCN